MVSRWQKGFAALTLIFAFTLSACGGEQSGDNQSVNQNQNQNQNQCDPFLDPDCECDPLIHEDCEEEQNQQPQGCTEDAQCAGATPFCYTETNTCVSESFICTLLNCAGQRGVCDAPSRSCVDAEFCSSTADCLDGNLCIANSCQSEVEVCSACGPNQICNYNRNDLSVSCDNPVCEPSSRRCEGNTLLACNSSGTALNEIVCLDGCNETTGLCDLPQGDTCENPLITVPGESVEIDWSYYSNQIEPAFGTGCLDNAAQGAKVAGPDLTWAFEIPAGEVGIVRLTTPEDYGLLYLMEDCQEEAVSCVKPEGATATAEDDSFVRTLWFYNDEDEAKTMLVVADSTDNAANGLATIEFELHQRICEPLSQLCTDSDISECNILGTQWDFQLTCTLGCHQDEDDRCATEIYTSCEDAIDASGTTFSFTGDMADLAAPEPFNTADECESSPRTGARSTFSGPVAYFRRSLAEGERMTISLAATFDAGIWLATDCLDGGGQCKAAVNTNMTESTEAEELVYIAPEDEDLIFAVQAVNAMNGAAGRYTLELLVESPECAEKENGEILGCNDSGLLTYCTGTDYPSFHACEGGCASGACVEPQGDRCFDAIPASAGQTYSGSFSDQSHALKAPSACFGGTNITTAGADTIYRIEIPNQHLLTAEVKSPSTNVGVYLIADCPNTGALSQDACLTSSFPAKTLSQHFVEGGTYYLVVASKNAKESAGFTLEIDLSPAGCEPGTLVCSNGVTRVCDNNGQTWTAVETCAASCEAVADGEVSRRCGALEKPNDRCDQPLLITGPSVIRGSFGDHKARMIIHEDDCNEAKVSLQGPEAYYQVDMAPKSGLVATVKTSATAYFMSLQECGNTGSCDLQKVGTEDDVFEYYSPHGGTQYLVLKAASASATQDFEITFEYFEGECTPDINTCGTDGAGNDIAIACNSIGQQTETICDFGCFEGQCLDRMGDLCSRPFDIDNDPTTMEDQDRVLFQHSGTLAGFANHYDAFDPESSTSCTGWATPGNEVVYMFKGWRTDKVDINLNSTFDGNIWITTDCETAATSCVAGVDNTFGPGQETLQFEVEETATYFVMVDGFQAGNSGSFTLDVEIEKGPRLDEAKLELGGIDDLIFDVAVGESGSTQITITNNGGWDLPFELTHTTAWMEFSPASGSVSSGATETVEITFECATEGVQYGNFELTYEDPEEKMLPLVLQVNCLDSEP